MQQANYLRLGAWGLVAAALLTLVAMALTSELRWGPQDVLLAGLLLGGGGLAIELGLRLVRGTPARLALAAAILAAVALIWAELAVGLFH